MFILYLAGVDDVFTCRQEDVFCLSKNNNDEGLIMLWANDWGWGAATVICCIFLHVTVLFYLAKILFNERVAQLRTRSGVLSSILFSIFALCAMKLHVIESLIWTTLYIHIGAANNFPDAFLHSLGAFTTLGDSTVVFDKKWRLLIQIEALNGAVALGLTTAFLYSASHRLQKIATQAQERYLEKINLHA